MSADTPGCMAATPMGMVAHHTQTPERREFRQFDRVAALAARRIRGVERLRRVRSGPAVDGTPRPDRTSCARGLHRVLLGVGGHGDLQSRTSPHDHSSAQTPHRIMVSTLHPGKEHSLDRAAAPLQRGEPRPARRRGPLPGSSPCRCRCLTFPATSATGAAARGCAHSRVVGGPKASASERLTPRVPHDRFVDRPDSVVARP